MVLIGIVGKMGVGKDYIYNILIKEILKENKVEYLQLAFADQIKINIMSKKNIPYNDVYVKKTQKSRMLLQNEGTEHGRESIDKDIWVKYLDNWITVFINRGINNFIITDCRFLNELEYIKKQNGILIKIIAPNRNNERLIYESNYDQEIYDKIKNHKSECDLDNYLLKEFDLVLYNDPGEFNYDEYYSKLKNILIKNK